MIKLGLFAMLLGFGKYTQTIYNNKELFKYIQEYEVARNRASAIMSTYFLGWDGKHISEGPRNICQSFSKHTLVLISFKLLSVYAF